MADKKKTRVTVYDSKGNPSGPPKTKVKAPKLNGNGKKKTKVDNKKPKVKRRPQSGPPLHGPPLYRRRQRRVNTAPDPVLFDATKPVDPRSPNDAKDARASVAAPAARRMRRHAA